MHNAEAVAALVALGLAPTAERVGSLLQERGTACRPGVTGALDIYRAFLSK